MSGSDRMKLVIWLCLVVQSAQCYSEGSHQAIAFAAHQILSDMGKDFVQSAFNLKNRNDVAQTMMDVSSWADRMGNTTVPGSANWHFNNVPDDFVEYIPGTCNRKTGCLVSALADQIAIAADIETSPEELQQAVKFVIHLIADLHQPLHVGRASDDGGNRIRTDLDEDLLKRLDRLGKASLHKIWDLALPQFDSLRVQHKAIPAPLSRIASKSDRFPRRTPMEVGLNLAAMITKKKCGLILRGITSFTIDNGNHLEWLFGSLSKAVHETGLASAYQTDGLEFKNSKLVINEQYLESNIPTLQRLLCDASAGLGHVLNAIALARARKSGLTASWAAASATAPPADHPSGLIFS